MYHIAFLKNQLKYSRRPCCEGVMGDTPKVWGICPDDKVTSGVTKEELLSSMAEFDLNHMSLIPYKQNGPSIIGKLCGTFPYSPQITKQFFTDVVMNTWFIHMGFLWWWTLPVIVNWWKYDLFCESFIHYVVIVTHHWFKPDLCL